MGSRARKGLEAPAPKAGAPKRSRSPRFATADETPVGSQANELQRLVESRFADEFDPLDRQKWHPAATLGFVFVTCGGFWAAVALVATRIF
jgi:hypothetical protein